MLRCPNCGAELEGDFGMVMCSSCRVISVIDLDGNIKLNTPEEEPSPVLDAQEFPLSAPVGEAVDFVAGESTFQPEENSFDFSGAQQDAPSEPAEPDEPFLEEPIRFGGVASEQEEPAPASSAEDLSDIAAYGNSDQASAREGLFVFDLTVSGIDTRELREAVRQSLEDRRFLWDAARLMSTIEKGVLQLPRLNSVQTTIVVSRLKGLPLEIHWKQSTVIDQ